MIGRLSTQRLRGDFSLKARTNAWCTEEYMLQCYYDGWKRHLRAAQMTEENQVDAK